MQITYVKDEDFRCPDSGRVRVATRNPRSASDPFDDACDAVGRAVEADHPCSLVEDNTCDIAAAMERGHPLSAAWLLIGATDPTITGRMLDALKFNGITVDLREAFDAWCASPDSEPLARCYECNSCIYGDREDLDWSITGIAVIRCDNCHARTKILSEIDEEED